MPIRFAGQANRSAGLSARAPDSSCPLAGEKKPAGWTTQQAFLPEGWSSRRTWAQRVYTNHSAKAKHCTAPAARAVENCSRSGLMCKSPNRQAENKRPGGLRPTGSCQTREAEPPDVKGSRKSIRRKRGATYPPQPCGSSMRFARSGTASWNLVLGRWPQRDGKKFGGGRVTPYWRFGNRCVARTQQRGAEASSQGPARSFRKTPLLTKPDGSVYVNLSSAPTTSK
jgi:hypothetical protein